MWTALFYDPVFWVALLAFSFVIGYFYWQEKKEREEKQRKTEEELRERIRKLEEKVETRE